MLDWRSGLESACRAVGRPLGRGEFERIIDMQGALERGDYLDYTEITCRSLERALALPREITATIAARAGDWPLFADSGGALRTLMRIAPCAALSNSDRIHGEQVQAQLGFRLSDWLCAEEARVYKPNPEFWQLMADRREIEPGPHWWHVSAYADYDLAVANRLGLTTVFVERPHARRGPAAHTVRDLAGLAAMWE